MKFSKLALINLFCLASFSAVADESPYNQQTSTNTETLVKYLQHLGGYLGYDLTQSPESDKRSVSQELIKISTIQLAQNYVYNTFWGALPVNTFSKAFAQFIPTLIPGANMINSLANATFLNQNYNSPAENTMSVNALVDQPTFQSDPVSQAVLNILGTADYSYCLNDDGSEISDCKEEILNKQLLQNQVTTNALGTLPKPNAFFSYDYIKKFMGQLNSNVLIGPLLYSAENTDQSTGSPPPASKENPGLVAQNQIQAAANFIRYASGSVTPITLLGRSGYVDRYKDANDDKADPVKRMKAQNTLSAYLANLRIYAAQTSVPIGNLYYILSKRMPQKQSTDNTVPETSQAVSEFNMASWRLFSPDKGGNNSEPNKQWIAQINEASSATVQKEIATLLAEINYQMYLDRQLQERLLLTNSIMLLQTLKQNPPKTELENQASDASNEQ